MKSFNIYKQLTPDDMGNVSFGFQCSMEAESGREAIQIAKAMPAFGEYHRVGNRLLLDRPIVEEIVAVEPAPAPIQEETKSTPLFVVRQAIRHHPRKKEKLPHQKRGYAPVAAKQLLLMAATINARHGHLRSTPQIAALLFAPSRKAPHRPLRDVFATRRVYRDHLRKAGKFDAKLFALNKIKVDSIILPQMDVLASVNEAIQRREA